MTTDGPELDTTVADPLVAAADIIAGFGVAGRKPRQLVAMLTDGPHTLAELIRDCALPRVTVEALLRAIDPDLEQVAGEVRIRADRTTAYRERFAYNQLSSSTEAMVQALTSAAPAELARQLAADIAAAPPARSELDHVSASADTLARRALWLAGTFDLAGARLLCVGDHDLTSLAVAAVAPEAEITVVDIDERLLEYIDDVATRRSYRIRCLFADFRFGIPESAEKSADLIFTDPPYTPEGVQLFLGRGFRGLRDRANGRLIMAYGFSTLHPALGLKVQQSMSELNLVTEAMLPSFNRYDGAQAVGSASDLYVCRPTSRTAQAVDRRLAGVGVNIYTHRGQSLEGRIGGLDETTAGAVRRAATDSDNRPPTLLVGDGCREWGSDTEILPLEQLLRGGLPAAIARRRPVEVAVDLSSDPGPWLLRVLLSANATRLAILVPNNHPDLVNQAAQRALVNLVAPKFTLKLRRSTPGPHTAIVEATERTDDDAHTIARHVLSRVHGKVDNVLRESLIQQSKGRPGGSLTKNEARALIAGTAVPAPWLPARPIDLPRSAIARLVAETETLAGKLE